MIIRQGWRYRLKTTPEVEHALRVQAGHARFVWNEALKLNLRRLEQGVPLLWRDALCGMIKLWKMTEQRDFLRDAHSQVLQQKLNDLASAFSDAFDPSQPHKRLPRFKRKGIDDRFRYPQGFKLARQVKFSANWHKTQARINRLHHKIACIRADYLHKLSTALSNSHAMIAVEALRIRTMSASAKGTTEAPGQGVRQKAGLNRRILDQG